MVRVDVGEPVRVGENVTPKFAHELPPTEVGNGLTNENSLASLEVGDDPRLNVAVPVLHTWNVCVSTCPTGVEANNVPSDD